MEWSASLGFDTPDRDTAGVSEMHEGALIGPQLWSREPPLSPQQDAELGPPVVGVDLGRRVARGGGGGRRRERGKGGGGARRSGGVELPFGEAALRDLVVASGESSTLGRPEASS